MSSISYIYPTVLKAEIEAGVGGFYLKNLYSAIESISNAGDVNGDGMDDLILGSSGDISFLVFGKDDSAPVDMFGLNVGTSGFVIKGRAGNSVSNAGDVNQDGLDDVLIGAWSYDGYNGAAYLVYGKTGGASVDLSDVEVGIGGFIMNGGSWPHEIVGTDVSFACGVNRDGIDDILIGAHSGPAYLVFGKDDTMPVDMSDIKAGIGGYLITGAWHSAGVKNPSVAYAGDVNGDGVGDHVFSARPSYQGGPTPGAVVAFGKNTKAPIKVGDIQAGIGGFFIEGTADNYYSTFSVSGAGDINGDGLDDVLVSDWFINKSYVVFGKTDGTPVDLADVESGIGGFLIDGTNDGRAGETLGSAGDFNGDGFADVIVGTNSGSYVVFGKSDTVPVGLADVRNGMGGFFVDIIVIPNGGAPMINNGATGDFNGDGLPDLFIGKHVVFGGIQPTPAILGTHGDDNPLAGMAGDGLILGMGGNDTIYGLGGKDDLSGGDGDDVLIGGDGGDTLTGGPGQDRAQYHQASTGLLADMVSSYTNTGEATGDAYVEIENLFGTNFDDQLRGDDQANTISGYGGHDIIHGREGLDALIGGDGDDFLIGGAGVDTYNGGNGNDRIQYQDMTTGLRADLQDSSTNTGDAAGETYSLIEGIVGSKADDFLFGDAGANWLHGFDGDDQVNGRVGDDVLFGNAGNDFLVGGAGNDILVGGSGIDTFVFDGADFGADRIIDFAPGELIDLTVYSGLHYSDLAIADVAGRAVISFANGEIVLTGIPAANVSAGMFDFAA